MVDSSVAADPVAPTPQGGSATRRHTLLDKVQRRLGRMVYAPLETLFRGVERREMSRSAVLDSIPPPAMRWTGGLGTVTYAEWCYVIGAFQSLIFDNLPERPIRQLDVGCGGGRIFLASKSSLTKDDTYLGIDVGKAFVDNCRRHYAAAGVEFLHTEASNAYYAGGVSGGPKPWPIADGAHNLITAVSVWTHLREGDFRFYLNEVGRVLSPGGRAIVTFFIMDEDYHPERKTTQRSSFYPQAENWWIFDVPAYRSRDFFAPRWAQVPEAAIGVTKSAFDGCVEQAGLKVVKSYPGSWKDRPALYFQDVVVLAKA